MFSLKHAGALALFLVSQTPVCSQAGKPEASVLSDAKSFMASYAEDLLGGKREAIISRYDPRGSYRVGQGKKSFSSPEETKTIYMEKWQPPVSFSWHDLSYEAVGKDAVVVVGLFDWGVSAERKLTFSYTSLLVNQEGGLKIRLEDESMALPPPPAKPESNARH